jgi:DNA modification methylase
VIIVGDCRTVMAGMEPNSVDAVVTDPPYGLEFMGKEWDKLDHGLPQENVWKGRRGKGGADVTGTGYTDGGKRLDRPSFGGNRTPGKRCVKCGKRSFSGSPCVCPEPEYVLEYQTGPPSGMVRQQRWHESWAREAYRVLKPGGHLLAFSGTRTSHRMVCAIEDAGFEIRDSIVWLYGSGFPKSLDVSKAMDKAAGAEREVIRERTYGLRNDGGYSGGLNTTKPRSESCEITTPATDLARQWDGWGTALKPAHEPICVARKPLTGTVARTVAEWGTGAINVDGCRIGTDDNLNGGAYSGGTRNPVSGETRSTVAAGMYGEDGRLDPEQFTQPQGRWPANVILDEDAAALLDATVGERKTGGPQSGKVYTNDRPSVGYGGGFDGSRKVSGFTDTGGPSRFMYTAKASRSERNAGLDGMPERATAAMQGNLVDGQRLGGDGSPIRTPMRQNHHPTVKPIALMRWLVRLVTPPGGLILDPFAGSGSTGCAAALEGFQFVGIEQSEEYAAIAERRIAYWAANGNRPVKGERRGGANATVTFGKMPVRKCNQCGTKAKESGPGGRWPNCDHDDWSWVKQAPIAQPTALQPMLDLEGVAD